MCVCFLSHLIIVWNYNCVSRTRHGEEVNLLCKHKTTALMLLFWGPTLKSDEIKESFFGGRCSSRLGAALERESAQSELGFLGDCCGCSVGAFALSILTATKPVMF